MCEIEAKLPDLKDENEAADPIAELARLHAQTHLMMTAFMDRPQK
jgi:hypothetical protein